MNPLLRIQRATGVVAATIPAGFTGSLSSLGLMNGDALLIRAGERWLNDLSTSPNLAVLTLSGLLVADTTKNTELRVTGIDGRSTGGYLVATQAAPLSSAFTHNLVVNGAVPAGRIIGFSHNADETSRGTPNDGGGLSRGIMLSNGCRFEVFGTSPAITNTTLYDTHATVGDMSIRLAGVVRWKAGWQFTLGMTNFLQSLSQADSTVTHTVAADTVPDYTGLFTVVTLTAAVAYTRWGKLQYGTGAGMSLTNDGYTAANLLGNVPTWMAVGDRTAYALEITNAIAAGAANVLDQRAPVSLLTRNVTISAPNDAAFSGVDRFGVHLMKMGLTGSLIMDSVEMYNCGQGGALGRYPIHWHMSSIDPTTGNTIGLLDGTVNVVNKCSIHASKHRAITFHGAQGARAINNSIHDILGHAIFLEDGSEMLNDIRGNFITHVRDPGAGYQVKEHDNMPTGLWITNAYNRITDNRMSDCHVGRWLIPTDKTGRPIGSAGGCLGLSFLSTIDPVFCAPLEFARNVCHSNFEQGAVLNNAIYTNRGTLALQAKSLSPTDTNTSTGNEVPSAFTGEVMFKNNGSGALVPFGGGGNQGTGNYVNAVKKPLYTNFVMADALGSDLSGNTQRGAICQGMIAVAKSLNVESIQNTTTQERCAAASYHGLLTFNNCRFIGYADGNVQEGQHFGLITGNGVFRANDLYLNAIEMMGASTTGNHPIKSVMMWNAPGAYIRKINNTNYSRYDPVGLPFNPPPWNRGLGSLSLAKYDVDGRFGGTGIQKSYILYDVPFLTYGLTGLVAPYVINGNDMFSKVTTVQHYGLEVFRLAGLMGGLGGTFMRRYTGGIEWAKGNPTTFVADATAVYSTPVMGNYAGANSFTGGNGAPIARGSYVRLRQLSNLTGTAGAAEVIGITLTNFFRTMATKMGSQFTWPEDDYFFLNFAWPAAANDPTIYLSPGVDGSEAFSQPVTGPGSSHNAPKLANEAALRALTGREFAWCRGTETNSITVRVGYILDGTSEATDVYAAPIRNDVNLLNATDTAVCYLGVIPR